MKIPKKKNPFDDLDTEYRAGIENKSDEEIRAECAKVALAQHENLAAMKADLDLAEKKTAVKEAGAQYTEATKANKLRIAYAHFILAARGKA